MTGGDPRPFLTIVTWPQGLSHQEAVELIARATGHDVTDVRQRLARQPPFIYAGGAGGQLDPADAQRAAGAVLDGGGDAFTVTLADLAAFGPTLRIRDLQLRNGDLAIELWNGMATAVRRQDVQILVRARFVDRGAQEQARRETEALRDMQARVSTRLMGVQFGWAAQLSIADVFEDARIDAKTAKSSDKLDIHTRDGSVYQIDGDKFGYRVLGELRGHGDKANMDAMCELLSHLAPDEIVDTYYALWKPPAGCQRLRLPGPRPEDPAFAFYSRWAALLYRHVMG